MSSRVKEIASYLWKTSFDPPLVSRKIDVSKYPVLSAAIPDRQLEISEVFPAEELEEIWRYFSPYTDIYHISPIIESYGNVVIAIGNSDKNFGLIYLFDSDFGCFELEKSLNAFINNVVAS